MFSRSSGTRQQRRPSPTYPAQQQVAQSVQGPIRPPEYTRTQHLESYLNDPTLRRSTRKVSQDDSTYDTVFETTAGDALILRVQFVSGTPPAMMLVGVQATHSWLDSRMRVVGFTQIHSDQSWQNSTMLLGTAVQEVVKHFQLNPPHVLEITNVGLRKLQTTVRGSNSSQQTAQPARMVEQPRAKVAPTSDYESSFQVPDMPEISNPSTTTSFDANHEARLSGFPADPEPKWSTDLAPMKQKRSGHAAVKLDERHILVMGGRDENRNELKSTEVYDTRTNQWKPWPELNEKRYFHAAALCDRKVYVFGGSWLDSIECLDLSSESLKWKTMNVTLTCMRNGCTAAVVGADIYIVGGHDGSSWLSSVDILDTTMGTIRQGPSMTTARAGCVAGVEDNTIYIVGGLDSQKNRLNTIEYLTVDTRSRDLGKWHKCNAIMSTARWYPAVAVVYGCLVIIGGDDRNLEDVFSMEVFDTQQNVCWRLPEMNPRRYGCAAVTLNETKVVVAGGFGDGDTHASMQMINLNSAEEERKHRTQQLAEQSRRRREKDERRETQEKLAREQWRQEEKKRVEQDRLNHLVSNGFQLLENAAYGEALTKFREAAQLKPETAIIWAGMASCHEKLFQYDDMAIAARKCIQADPKDVQGHCALAEAQWKLGDFPGALDAVEAGLVILPREERLIDVKRNFEHNINLHRKNEERERHEGLRREREEQERHVHHQEQVKLAQEQGCQGEKTQATNLFESRAHLEAEVRKLRTIIDAAGGRYEPDIIENAMKAEDQLAELIPLLNLEQYRPIQDLEKDMAELKRQIDNAASFREKHRLAQECQEVKTRIEKEMRDERKYRLPEEQQESSDQLWKTWKAESPPESVPELAVSFLKECTDNFSESFHLGGGGFADVYRGVDARHGLEFAVKKHHRYAIEGRSGASLKKQILDEIKVLSQFKHDNIIRVLGYSLPDDDPGCQCLVYEYAPGGSLSTLLQDRNTRELFDWRRRIDVAYSVASALNYLNSRDPPCSHRDIKPENICFTEDLSRAILIDFGLAKLVDEAKLESAGGTIHTNLHGSSDPYVAPEYKDQTFRDASGKLIFDERCEVYSFGFVLQTLITGKLPLATELPMSPEQMVKRAQQELASDTGTWDPEVLKELSKVVKELSALAVCCMLPKEQRWNRPDFDHALDTLKPLKLRSRAKPTSKQSQTIQNSLTASVYRHGLKPVNRDRGQCSVCPRNSDRGLVCNSSTHPHFICDRCFAEHVKKNFGEIHIQCPIPGCTSEPCTERQLVEHLEPVLVAEHLEARSESRRNAENERRKAEQEICFTNEEIVRLLYSAARDAARDRERAARARERMSEGELGCPLLFVLSKPRNVQGSRQSWSPTIRNPLQTKKTYILYFLCAYDKSRINHGIVLRKSMDWVKKVVPALQIALFCLRVGFKVGVGVSLYVPDFLENLGVEGLMDEEILSNVSEEVDERLRQLEELLKRTDADESEIEEVFGELQNVSHEAYVEIAKIANAKENRGWRKEMRICEHDEGHAWVKKTNYEKWKADLEESIC